MQVAENHVDGPVLECGFLRIVRIGQGCDQLGQGQRFIEEVCGLLHEDQL